MVSLLIQQGGVEPGRRVLRVKTTGQPQFFSGQPRVAGVAERLAQITAQGGAIRFQRRGHLQVLPSPLGAALTDAAHAPPQPRVAQGRIDCDRLVKKVQRFIDPVLRGQNKTFQRNRLGIARRQLQGLLQRGPRLRRPSETEFEFSHAPPGETEGRRFFRSRFRGQQSRFELGT